MSLYSRFKRPIYSTVYGYWLKWINWCWCYSILIHQDWESLTHQNSKATVILDSSVGYSKNWQLYKLCTSIFFKQIWKSLKELNQPQGLTDFISSEKTIESMLSFAPSIMWSQHTNPNTIFFHLSGAQKMKAVFPSLFTVHLWSITCNVCLQAGLISRHPVFFGR